MAIDVVIRDEEIFHQTFFGSAVPIPVTAVTAIIIPVDEKFTMPTRKDKIKTDVFCAPPHVPIGGSAGISSQLKKIGEILD